MIMGHVCREIGALTVCGNTYTLVQLSHRTIWQTYKWIKNKILSLTAGYFLIDCRKRGKVEREKHLCEGEISIGCLPGSETAT